MSGRPGGDRGSISLWVVTAGALLLVVGTVAVGRTAAVLARHRAESAADLAALAAAGRIGVGGAPCAEARRIAEANSAHMRKCRVELGPGNRSGTVDVEVVATAQLPLAGARTVHASARAGRLPAVRAATAARSKVPRGASPLPTDGPNVPSLARCPVRAVPAAACASRFGATGRPGRPAQPMSSGEHTAR